MYGKRRSIRLKGYDYSQEGMYFVTIDLERKGNLFWKKEDVYELNEIGKMVEKCWLDLENRFEVELDEYIIMPNHFHGIIKINKAAMNKYNRATTRVARTLNPNVGAGFMPAQNINIIPAQNNLGNIIGAFKSIFVREYIRNVKHQNWPRFFRRLWQRDYYERIIRNEAEYLRIKQYIKDNPIKLVLK